MRRVAMLIAVAGVVVLSSGCASLNSSVPFQYQPSLLSSGQEIQKTAGFSMLTDDRPEKDRNYTKSIKDVPEKVTSKLIEDFEKSRLFQEVHYLPKENDDLVISGSIKRFKWKMYATPITYIPILNLVMYLGAPAMKAYGQAELQLEIEDRQTGQNIGVFSASSYVENSYTLYNFKSGEAGAELSEALREVAKELKQDIAARVGAK